LGRWKTVSPWAEAPMAVGPFSECANRRRVLPIPKLPSAPS